MTATAFARFRMRDTEFSRNVAAQSVVGCRVELDDVPGAVTVSYALVQEDSQTTIATKIVVPTEKRFDVGIDLTRDCFDPLYLGRAGHPDVNVYQGRYGLYHCVLTLMDGMSMPIAVVTTPSFAIMPVTVKELRGGYAYGLSGLASDVIAPVKQPVNITGVTIETISPTMYKANYTLRWNVGDATLTLVPKVRVPGFPPPSVAIDPNSAGTAIMHVSPLGGDYATIVYDGWDLPNTDAEDVMEFDNARIKDEVWRKHIFDAIRYVESKLFCYVEPVRIATDADLDPRAVDNDRMPVGYERPPSQNNWRTVRLPDRPLLVVNQLIGKMNDGKVLDIPPEWRKVGRQNGRVSLVPSAGSPINWLLYGPQFIGFLWYGFPNIPDFWHYAAIAGIPDFDGEIYSDVRELIAKRAMVNILQVMGRALAGGRSSESYSKDGINTSSSYTSGSGSPMYGAEIAEYSKQVEDGLKRARQRVLGIISTTFS